LSAAGAHDETVQRLATAGLALGALAVAVDLALAIVALSGS
jgi:hypothetical protein